MPIAPANARQNAEPCRAFTLLELVVVVAFLALSVVMLVPALAGSRPNVKSVQCMANLRQLSAAWTMYPHDYSDKLANNFTVNETVAEINSGTYQTWACHYLDWTSNARNTNTLLLGKSLLARYLNGNLEAYRCPADNYLSLAQRHQGWAYRLRSYSMNVYLGANDKNDSTGRNYFFPYNRQWLKFSDISKPGNFFAFIEEHPDSINDGIFLNNPTANYWGDFPSSYHHGASAIAYCDGRVEMHKWRSTMTRQPVRFNYPPAFSFDALGVHDYQWLISRAAELY